MEQEDVGERLDRIRAKKAAALDSESDDDDEDEDLVSRWRKAKQTHQAEPSQEQQQQQQQQLEVLTASQLGFSQDLSQPQSSSSYPQYCQQPSPALATLNNPLGRWPTLAEEQAERQEMKMKEHVGRWPLPMPDYREDSASPWAPGGPMAPGGSNYRPPLPHGPPKALIQVPLISCSFY
jgi:hypothetical protein